jgi:hypothetical protein
MPSSAGSDSDRVLALRLIMVGLLPSPEDGVGALESEEPSVRRRSSSSMMREGLWDMLASTGIAIGAAMNVFVRPASSSSTTASCAGREKDE